MTSTRFAQLGLRAMLGAGLLWACGPAQALTAMAAQARVVVGTVAFDRENQALVVPMTGAQPKYAVRRLAPRQYVAEFEQAELQRDELQGQRLTGVNLSGWSLSESPDGSKVYLRMMLQDDVAPRLN